MNKFLIIFLFWICFSLSCRNITNNGNQLNTLDTSYHSANMIDSVPRHGDLNDKIIPIRLAKDSLDLTKDFDKQFFFDLLNKQGVEMSSLQNIDRVSLYKSNVNVTGYGLSDVYEIELSQNLPVSIKKQFFEVISKSRKEGGLFYLDSIFFFEFEDHKEYYIAGINMIRKRGYFIIYDFETDKFIATLNTFDLCNAPVGLPVVMVNTDCINYEGDSLTIKNIDVNNDDTLDISLRGSLLVYCQGYELGKSKDDGDTVKKRIDIDVELISHFKQGYPFWTSKGINDNFCELLSKY